MQNSTDIEKTAEDMMWYLDLLVDAPDERVSRIIRTVTGLLMENSDESNVELGLIAYVCAEISRESLERSRINRTFARLI